MKHSCNPATCDAYKISQGKACEGCPDNPDNWQKEFEPELLTFSNHIIWLHTLRLSGCGFQMDDLSLTEWKGLEILERELKRKELEDIEEMKRKR